MANVAELVVKDALRNWARNFRGVTPALGSMSVMLLFAGTAGILGLAAENVVQDQASQASIIHLYLKQGATEAQVRELRTRLAEDPRVASATYVSAAEALRQARQRPGMSQLIDAAGGNPFPAGFEVHVGRLSDVNAVVAAVEHDPALDPSKPSSYDPDTYARLQTFLGDAGLVVLGLVLVLALIAAAVTANAIRAAILARSADVTIMRLVGAGRWMVRGPFVFEGAVTGAVAGAVSATALLALFAASRQLSAQAFTAVLPGVGWEMAAICGAALVGAGVCLGSAASLVGLRGLRA
jgi:cell division transport system permease protein